MATFEPREPARRGPRGFPILGAGVGTLAVLALGGLILSFVVYNMCKFEVRQGQQAVLIRLVGNDLDPDMEIAPAYSTENGYSKGVQPGVLTEGRYFYNPFYWNWEISDQYVVPQGKCAVRIDLVGEDLPIGQVLADEGQKGIRHDVIEAGARVAYNSYATAFEEVDPVDVYPGGRGVVTLLAGKAAAKPNTVLVEVGERGVQKETLAPGKYFLNPYERRVSVVDCRTQRFGLNTDADISFLSSDGFSISLDGVVSFRVMEEKAAEVYVLYNEDQNGDVIEDEIINKIVTPYARSICRINGSKLNAVQFISGDDKAIFQQDLEKSLEAQCEQQGIEIVSVAITGTQAPPEITAPVMAREESKQRLDQYLQEKLEKDSEAQLRVQTLEADQKAKLVDAQQQVVEAKTKSEQEQDVAVTLAEQRLAVAETGLEAAQDKAAALMAEAQAAADVIRFKNTAELSGLDSRVQAFGGDGRGLAQNILMGKLAPAYRSILSNSEGPLMELFGQFTKMPAGSGPLRRPDPSASTTATAPPIVPRALARPEPAAETPAADTIPAEPFDQPVTDPSEDGR